MLKKHKPGKGDLQEGVYAAYELSDFIEIKKELIKDHDSFCVRLTSSNSDQAYLVNKKQLHFLHIVFT